MRLKYLSVVFLALSSLMVSLNGTLKHGVAHMQGRRPTMEDAHTSIDRLSDGQTSLFAIFDGHGGSRVADYVAQRIQYAIERSTEFPRNLPATLHNAFDYLDSRLIQGSLKDIALTSGSTAVVTLIHDNQLYSAHAGDSRAVLSRNGQALALTNDHKPDRPDEKARIEAAGGSVVTLGVPRVNGRLAVSRAFGDLALRTAGVIATPEIIHVTLTPQDEFLLLACDGVFEKDITDQQAINFVRNSLIRHTGDSQAAQKAAQELIQEAYRRGSGDNISALVILFNQNQNQNNASLAPLLPVNPVNQNNTAHNRHFVRLLHDTSRRVTVIAEALPTQGVFQDLFLTREFLTEIARLISTQEPTHQALSISAAKVRDVLTFIANSPERKRSFISAYGTITLEQLSNILEQFSRDFLEPLAAIAEYQGT